VIRSFADRGTEDVFNGRNTADARRTCPRSLWRTAARKLDQIDSVDRVEDLGVPPGNRLERLVGAPRGQYSVRINDQYRICFEWQTDGAHGVEIADDH
jgi:proteic killer suppression protein